MYTADWVVVAIVFTSALLGLQFGALRVLLSRVSRFLISFVGGLIATWLLVVSGKFLVNEIAQMFGFRLGPAQITAGVLVLILFTALLYVALGVVRKYLYPMVPQRDPMRWLDRAAGVPIAAGLSVMMILVASHFLVGAAYRQATAACPQSVLMSSVTAYLFQSYMPK